MKIEKPMIAIAVVCVIALVAVVGRYAPGRPNGDIARIQGELNMAKRAEASERARSAAAEQALEHAHTLVVRDTVKLHPHVAAYDFGKSHLDTTSVDSLKKQLARADTVIDGAFQTISDQADEIARANELLAVKDDELQTKDWRAEKLMELNTAIAAQIPTRRQQLVHDAKVAVLTIGVAGGLAAIKAAFGQ